MTSTIRRKRIRWLDQRAAAFFVRMLPSKKATGTKYCCWLVMGFRRMSIPLLAALVAGGTAFAQPHKSYKHQILQKGIFDAQVVSHAPVSGIWRVQNPRLVKATSNIPLRRNLRFGLRYLIAGSGGRHSVPVELVTRYPSPGILDRATGEHRLQSSHRLEITTGVVVYRDFQFIEDEEFVPGKWVFEFWIEGRKVAEEAFCVFGPNEQRRLASGCEEVGS
ncbi:DUF3859 domain-containing protein [Bradyrhizobium sp. CSA112]|uniref:DUF3859 domain-containing protein n=1 Tax=Bradyrhizobium sp. CSA112 TaxID=2699170 RepID=UPI0023B121E6|nr:DUF3859 domain-containing protein [Bradyrhizobium sp. CSA112]MDE5455616.1 DUF3859 domain-containing protein [Bradyrhizobium sp. CSA112]